MTPRLARVAGRALHPCVLDATQGKAPNLTHLGALCHHLGVVQFAQGDTRDMSSGFCVDDNARALIVAVDVLRLEPLNAEAHRIGEAALALLERTQLPDGFHNLLDDKGDFIVEGGRSQDATGRAIWALGATVTRSTDDDWRARAENMINRQWNAARGLTASRARAYAILGTALLAGTSERARRTVEQLAGSLLEEFNAHATDDWPWWEPVLVWGNGRLPEAMLRAAIALGRKDLGDCGMRSLQFLGEVTHERNLFVPIGNDGWYPRGGTRARYDQQPIEACAMVDAWLAAVEYTLDDGYRARALEAFAWFVGANTERLVIADPQTGGCHDGLGAGWRNRNMGAESTLSYLAAHLAIARNAM